MSTTLKPQEDRAYFGCPDCGNVWTLPWDGTAEDRPYCVAHGENYAWRPDTKGEWTQCVIVKVIA